MTDPEDLPLFTRDALRVMAHAGVWPEGLHVVGLAPGCETACDGPDIPASLPAIVVALDDMDGRDADILATTAGLAPIMEMIRTHPAAALALVQLLRVTGRMSVEGALVAESLTYAALQGSAGFGAWCRTHIRKPPPRKSAPVLLHHAYSTHDHLVLNRAARANMINATLRQALVAALGALALDGSARPILLTGAGRWFCAGGDTHEFGLVASPDTGHVLRQRANLPGLVAQVADRLHVHLHGAVIGAGLELAAFARRVTAHPDTTFRLPELAMGLIPGCGGTVSLPRRIGRERLARLCLSDATLDCATALDWGLIDGIAADPPAVPFA